MPEFRFRRKKQGNRRHTLNNSVEAAVQIQAARDQVTNGDRGGGEGASAYDTNTLTREREKFMDLLKSKYPEHVSADLDRFAGDQGPSPAHRSTISSPSSSLANGHDVSPQSDEPTKYQSDDDVIVTTSSSELPMVTASFIRRISSRFNECIFLRYGSDLRHCPMPSPITLSTVRNLFVNMFDLSPSLLDDNSPSQVFIKDKESEKWKELVATSMIYDRSTVLLVDPSQGHTLPSDSLEPALSDDGEAEGDGEEVVVMLEGGDPEITANSKRHNGLWHLSAGRQFSDLTALSDSMPLHSPPEALLPTTSPFSINSSTSGVGSEIGGEQRLKQALSSQAGSLRRETQRLREELDALRRHHATSADDFSRSLQATKEGIQSAVSAYTRLAGLRAPAQSEKFRRERLEIYTEEEAYTQRSGCMLNDLDVLEAAVEGVRLDVVERRCHVVDQEVEGLSSAVQSAGRALQDLKGRFTPLEEKLKRVMEQELKTIVQEESFVAEENARLQEADSRHHKLGEMLETLRQFSAVQKHRTPHVPFFSHVPNPDRHALMENIQAITPNHLHRMDCIQRAESVHKKKKALVFPNQELRMFENQLQVQHELLQRTRGIDELERRREMKLKANYLSEKFDREKRLTHDLELQKRAKEQKREREKQSLQDHWLLDQAQRAHDRRGRERRSHKTAPQGATGKGRVVQAFVSNGINPVHKNAAFHPAARVSLAPQAHTLDLRNLSPRDRKSIGYFGEYDSLEPRHSLSQPEVLGGSGEVGELNAARQASRRPSGGNRKGSLEASDVPQHHPLSITSSSTSGSQASVNPPAQAAREKIWDTVADPSANPTSRPNEFVRSGTRATVNGARPTVMRRFVAHEAAFNQPMSFEDDFICASLSQPELLESRTRGTAEVRPGRNQRAFAQQRATSDESIYNDKSIDLPGPLPTQPADSHAHLYAKVRKRHSYHQGELTTQLLSQDASGNRKPRPHHTKQPSEGSIPSKAGRHVAAASSHDKHSEKHERHTPVSPAPVVHHSYTHFASGPKSKSPVQKNRGSSRLPSTHPSASLRGGGKKESKQPKQHTHDQQQEQTAGLAPGSQRAAPTDAQQLATSQPNQTGQSNLRHSGQPSSSRVHPREQKRQSVHTEKVAEIDSDGGMHWTLHGIHPTAKVAPSTGTRHHQPPPPPSHQPQQGTAPQPHTHTQSQPHPHTQSQPHTHTQSQPHPHHARPSQFFQPTDKPLTSYPRFHGGGPPGPQAYPHPSHPHPPHPHPSHPHSSTRAHRGSGAARGPANPAHHAHFADPANSREPAGSLV